MIRRYLRFMTPDREAAFRDAGLLILRVSAGLLMAFGHGLGKIQKLFAGGPYQWADPIGLGPGLSLALAGGAEFFCSLLLVAGLATRAAAVPLAFTMCVAAFIVHGDDPFKRKELALFYLSVYAALILAGPGRWSLDAWLRRRLDA